MALYFSFSRLLLYKTLVRLKLEYAASVWDTEHETLFNAVELVQSNVTALILGRYHIPPSSVTSMKITLSLPSLAQRLKIVRLSLCHKMHTPIPILKQELLHQPSYMSSRHDATKLAFLSATRTPVSQPS